MAKKIVRAMAGQRFSRTAEYRAWEHMKNRCYRPTVPGYKNYGGRGIRVCDRWLGEDGAANFLADMGPRPSAKHSVDRIDNDGDYTPENCRWATRAEQSRNRRRNVMLTHDGLTMCVADWADRLGIKRATLQIRVRRGWSVARMLTTPPDVRFTNRGGQGAPRGPRRKE